MTQGKVYSKDTSLRRNLKLFVSRNRFKKKKKHLMEPIPIFSLMKFHLMEIQKKKKNDKDEQRPLVCF